MVISRRFGINAPMAMYRWILLSTQRMEVGWYERLFHIDPEHLLMLMHTETSAVKI